MPFAMILDPPMGYRHTIVPPMIVNKDDLEILHRLPTQALKAGLDVGGGVVEGRDDGNHGR